MTTTKDRETWPFGSRLLYLGLLLVLSLVLLNGSGRKHVQQREAVPGPREIIEVPDLYVAEKLWHSFNLSR